MLVCGSHWLGPMLSWKICWLQWDTMVQHLQFSKILQKMNSSPNPNKFDFSTSINSLCTTKWRTCLKNPKGQYFEFIGAILGHNWLTLSWNHGMSRHVKIWRHRHQRTSSCPGRQWNGEEILAIFLFQSRMKKLICDS